MHLTQWFLLAIPLAPLAFGQTCYWPSGGIASALKPCSIASGNEVAACCFANHYCTTNGLCLSPTEGTWYRGGCTDKEYQRTGCPKFCDRSDIVGATPAQHGAVWACASRVFACSSLDNCAKQNFTVGPYRAVMNLALQTDLSNDMATATATATATRSTGASSTLGPDASGDANTTTCPSDAQAGGGISTGAAAGVGLGVGLPLAISVAALTFMLMREKKKAREALAGYQQQPGYSQQAYTGTTSPRSKAEEHHILAAEISGRSMPPELDSSTHGRHELPHW